MKSKCCRDSECWQSAKEYFIAMGREHMIGVIERGVELKEKDFEEMDSDKHQGVVKVSGQVERGGAPGLSTPRIGEETIQGHDGQ